MATARAGAASSRLCSMSKPIPYRTTLLCNAEISRLSRSPNPQKSLPILLSMLSSGLPIDSFTLPPILRSLPSPSLSFPLHALSLKLGLLPNSPFLASSLLLSYLSLPSPSLSLPLRLFHDIPFHLRDSVLYTSMLSAFSRLSFPLLSLSLFSQMLSLHIPIDEAVLVTVISSCSQLGCLRRARAIHAYSLRVMSTLTLNLGNVLIDMYVKCGAFGYADNVFDKMPHKDVFSWSTLILGHGLNGRASSAITSFDNMIREGKIRPNGVTFLGVLSACTHSGMVEKAWKVLDMMRRYGVRVELKHYACMVDVLGRAGELKEAERLVEEMPVEADEAVLGALLSGCRVHGDVEVGERVARRLMRMCPGKSGYYASLANLYSDAGRFEDAERVRGLMRRMNVEKVVGVTSIELDGSSLQTHS